jgi:hypothetical protein
MNGSTAPAGFPACASLRNKEHCLIVQDWIFDLVIWHERNSPPVEDFVPFPVVMRTIMPVAMG